MTSRNGISSLKISRAAIRKGCNDKEKISDSLHVYNNSTMRHSTSLSYTYTENCDESINRRNLKTRNACKVTSSEEGNIEKDNLVNRDLL